MTKVINRAVQPAVALESTLLAHGVPRHAALDLHARITSTVRERGAHPALTGVVGGNATVGMTDDELRAMLDADAGKLNTSNLGFALHRGEYGATTVSTTVELAAAAGVRVFATGGLGGVHRGYGTEFDISADIGALARHPVAVVSAGVKSILDVAATRELLETMGVPVIGFGTDRFPAFYSRESDALVDARFDDPSDLAAYLESELRRTGRGALVAQPIATNEEIPRDQFDRWMRQASAEAHDQGVGGRDATPFVLGRLHDLSEGATLHANIELVVSNADLAARLAAAWPGEPS